MSGDLTNDPNWRKKAPYGLHTDGTPITKEEYEQNTIQQSQRGGIRNIKVTVDNQALDFAQERAQKAEQEAEELREKLDLVAQAQAEEKLNKLKINDPELREKFTENPDMIYGYEQAMKDAQKQKRPEITGSAPLDYYQLHGGKRSEGFESQEALIDDLRRRSHLGDAQAEQILGKLLEKTVQGVKKGKQGFGQIETPENESEIQRINRINREKHIRNLRKRAEEGEN
jgi:hypothetical protein